VLALGHSNYVVLLECLVDNSYAEVGVADKVIVRTLAFVSIELALEAEAAVVDEAVAWAE
jgi:hypothetical protein